LHGPEIIHPWARQAAWGGIMAHPRRMQVQDVRIAVQYRSDVLVPVQRLLARVNQEKDREKALQLAM